METITLSKWEYNILMNEHAALNRAMEVLLHTLGASDIQLDNVYIYPAEGGGVGTWFVDEVGERLKDIDYALADYGQVE